MNYDSVWQTVRYFLIAAGTFLVGMNYADSETWTQFMSKVETFVTSAMALGAVLWGWYVKWNTTPVLDTVIEVKNIPVVDSATGKQERIK